MSVLVLVFTYHCALYIPQKKIVNISQLKLPIYPEGRKYEFFKGGEKEREEKADTFPYFVGAEIGIGEEKSYARACTVVHYEIHPCTEK